MLDIVWKLRGYDPCGAPNDPESVPLIIWAPKKVLYSTFIYTSRHGKNLVILNQGPLGFAVVVDAYHLMHACKSRILYKCPRILA